MIRHWSRLSRRTRLILISLFGVLLLQYGSDWYARRQAWAFLSTRGYIRSRSENRRSAAVYRDLLLVTQRPFPWYQKYPNRVRDYLTYQGVESLCLNETISNEMIDAICVFPTTTMLCFRKSSITDSQLQRLSGFHKLDELNLEETSVTDMGLACLTTFPELKGLWLGHTAITDKSIPVLLQLRNFETLRITSTEIPASGAKH